MWRDPWSRHDPLWMPRSPFSGGVRWYGLHFSSVEITQMIHAILILTLAFGIFLSNLEFEILPYTLILAFPAVITAFFIPEIVQKYMAQRYGAWSEFRAHYMWLLITLFISPIAILAVPGTNVIMGYLDREREGKLAMSHGATNLAVALILIPFYYFLTVPVMGSIPGMDLNPDLSAMGLLGSAIFYTAWINIVFAFFAFIPIPGLNGYRIFRWNPMVLIVAFFAVLFTFFVYSSIP